jgi:hypothetical protein
MRAGPRKFGRRTPKIAGDSLRNSIRKVLGAMVAHSTRCSVGCRSGRRKYRAEQVIVVSVITHRDLTTTATSQD